jgi:hypothetical protein
VLTSFIKAKDVREKFDQEFNKPEVLVTKPLLVPALSKRSSMIGTAFDYLLRFRLQRLNPQSIERRPWVAEEPLRFYEEEEKHLWPADRKNFAKIKTIISNAQTTLSTFLESGTLSDAIIKSALELATIDAFERSGNGEDLIGITHKQDMQELRSLFQFVKDEDFKTKELCLLNPTFGSASTLVCGADADFVIDETLVDIKTTQSLKLEAAAFRQIVGYYVLHQLGSVGELEPKTTISKLAIYFSRFGYMHTMNIRDIVNVKTFPDFLKWFDRRAKEEWPPEHRN